MLLFPVPEKFNTFNTFNNFDRVSDAGSCDRSPGMPDGNARTDGHGGHQDGNRLRRQCPAGEPDDHERNRRRKPNQHHTIGEMAGARRA